MSAFLPGAAIEVVRERPGRGRPRCALLDFDGTVSLLRQGWPEVMMPMMVEQLRAAPRAEPAAAVEELVRDFVERSTGRMTILQMEWLAAEVAGRGGPRREPLEYKREYLRRLEARIRGRLEALESGRLPPEAMLVPGAREFLELLAARGAVLCCASGTDQPDVLREARLLGVADLFAGGIRGAEENSRECSKQAVIRGLLAEGGLRGPELLVVGDGYVEIEEGRAAGALCLGAATDEAARAGVDQRKRARLIAAGADLIVPDFRQARRLVAWLFGE